MFLPQNRPKWNLYYSNGIYGDKKIFYKIFLFIIEKYNFLVEMPPEKEVLWFFSEGQIIRISLSLIPNAPWVCLSKNTIPVPEAFHEGYNSLPPNCGCGKWGWTLLLSSVFYSIVSRIKYHPFSNLQVKTLMLGKRVTLVTGNGNGWRVEANSGCPFF